MKLSIIIPVYKDTNGLNHLIDDLNENSNNQNFEVILIDDGNEKELKIENTNNLDIKILKNETNKGYGYSIKKGVANSKNDVIAIIDADNSYKINDLFKLYDIFLNDKSKLIVGKRNFNYQESLPRVIFRNFLKTFSSIIFQYNIEDINSGLRIFNKKDFNEFINYYPDKFSITSTQTLCYIMKSKNIHYHAIQYDKRVGISKINIIKDPFNFIFLILKIFLIFSPLKFFGGIGIFFIILSLLNIITSLFAFGKIADTSSIIFFTSGINFIFFGLIGEIIRLKIK